jgi:hypothetical protein
MKSPGPVPNSPTQGFDQISNEIAMDFFALKNALKNEEQKKARRGMAGKELEVS